MGRTRPPLQVYCDYEATTDPEGNQPPFLLCLEDDESDETHFFYGPDCTADMFDHLESLVVDMDGADLDVIVIFHNLKGYDGMFILQQLLCQTSRSHGSNHRGNQNTVSQIRQTDFQKLSVFSTISSGQFPRHLRDH